MQELINCCQQYCEEYCLSFNIKKSKILIFGTATKDQFSALTLNGKPLQFVTEWKYLGVTVIAGSKLSFSAKPALSAFYRAVNSILSVLRKPDEIVLMNLLFTNCVPILTNASETVEFSAGDMRNFNTAINDAMRRIYSYQRWESVRALRESAGFPSIYNIFSQRSEAFLSRNLKSANQVIVQLTVLLVSERIENERLRF